MKFEESVERIAALPMVRQAAQTGGELTELWPLTTAARMDNDAKYTENLQVRLSRMIARVMTGEDVTTPDAEFVYEGAESIPGRPQEIVDALLAANDALDGLAEYADSHDVRLLFDAAGTLGVTWSDGTGERIRTAVADAAAFADERMASAVEPLAWRFAVVVTLLDVLMRAVMDQVEAGTGDDAPHSGGAPEDRVERIERATLPLLPFANAVAETLAVPSLCVTAEQYHGIVAAYATPNGDGDPEDEAAVLAQVVAPLAGAEWRKHRDDVLWDPAEAKKRAKEEDERKNKEALAAKFAHIKDDPTKPEVEL